MYFVFFLVRAFGVFLSCSGMVARLSETFLDTVSTTNLQPKLLGSLSVVKNNISQSSLQQTFLDTVPAADSQPKLLGSLSVVENNLS